MVRLWGTRGREDLRTWELLGADCTDDELIVVDVRLWDRCRGGVDCGGRDDWRCRYWCWHLETWSSVDGRWALFDGVFPGCWYVIVFLAISFGSPGHLL